MDRAESLKLAMTASADLRLKKILLLESLEKQTALFNALSEAAEIGPVNQEEYKKTISTGAGNVQNVRDRQEKNRDRQISRQQSTAEGDYRGRFLHLQPGDQLTFENKGIDRDSSDLITLTNTTTGYVAFKVKTTAPEKFRVKPSFGCINAGESRNVEITIQPGFVTTAQRDKFLVMSAPLEQPPKGQNELIEYWHDILKDDSVADNVEEHRLRCQIVSTPENNLDAADQRNDTSPGPVASNVPTVVLEKLEAINAKVDRLMTMQYESAHSSSFMNQWNAFTVGFSVIVLFVAIHLLKMILGV